MTLTEERSAFESAEATTAAALNSAPAARRAMITNQLRTSGVNELWVLQAIAGVAREDFVPAGLRDAAYIDRAITLEDGTQLAEPLVHARMLQEAAPSQDDSILLVGKDSYLAALLRKVNDNVTVVAPADAANAGTGEYSIIVIDGAVEELPAALTARLAEGGRLVTGLVAGNVTRLAVGAKSNGSVALLPIIEMGIPALRELAAPKRWSF